MQAALTMPGYNGLNDYTDRHINLAAHFQHGSLQSDTSYARTLTTYAWSRVIGPN